MFNIKSFHFLAFINPLGGGVEAHNFPKRETIIKKNPHPTTELASKIPKYSVQKVPHNSHIFFCYSARICWLFFWPTFLGSHGPRHKQVNKILQRRFVYDLLHVSKNKPSLLVVVVVVVVGWEEVGHIGSRAYKTLQPQIDMQRT